VGSDNSSNSNRLVEVAGNLGTKSYLIENYRSIKHEWLQSVKTIALTAGASAPEALVEEVVEACRSRYDVSIEEVAITREEVRFNLPHALDA
jgi:4-hydroxy-3-methylbut-2-enyl diphosphate reductase